MTVAHIMGMPVEESVLQLVSAGTVVGAALTVVASRLRAARVIRFRRGGRAARD